MVITDSLGRETERVYDVPASCKSTSTCEITMIHTRCTPTNPKGKVR